MPRTASAAEAALLASGHYHWYGRAEVTNASGTWIDVTSWVYGWSWGEAVDDASESGTIEFIREADVGGVDGGVVVADDFEDAIGAINARWPITKVGPETGTTAESWGQLTTTEGDTAIVVNTQNGIGFDNTGVFTAPHTYGPADGLVAGERYRVSCRMGLAGFNTTSQIAGLRAIGETTVEVLTPDFGDQTLQTFVRADAAGEITVELFLDTTPLTGGWSRQWTVNTVRIADAAQGRHSLAPLWQGSPLNVDDAGDYAPLVQPFRRVRLWEAVVAPGTEPTEGAWPEGDWHEVFRGVIDDPDWGGEESRVVCGIRGEGARLADGMIEEVIAYDSALLETIAQLILDNAAAAGSIPATTLLVPEPSAWQLEAFEQPLVPVHEAIAAKALQRGWTARYRWHDALAPAETYRYTLVNPERTTDTVDLTYGPDTIELVPRHRLDGTTVRNSGRIVFVDGETGQLVPWEDEDDDSVAAYGRRWFEIREDAASAIDSLAEAQAMLSAALLDLATPFADFDGHLTGPDFRVQLNDVVAVLPIDRYFDSTQRFGVVGYRHERGGAHGPRAGKTFLSLRGRPAGSFRRWLAAMGTGKRPQRSALPAPVIGPLLGEASAHGGEVNDGSAWLKLGFEPRTVAIKVFAKTGPTTPLPAPDLKNTQNWSATIVRPPGAIGTIAFETWHRMACWPGYFKKAGVVGVGPNGEESPARFLEVQAVDAHAATLLAATGVTVTRAGADNVISWTAPGGMSSTYVPPVGEPAITWHVKRNGIIIGEVAHVAGPLSFTDPDVDAGGPQDYQIYAFSGGISGPTGQTIAAPAGADIEFVNDTPVLVAGSGTTVVRVQGRSNIVGTATLVFEALSSISSIGLDPVGLSPGSVPAWGVPADGVKATTPGTTETLETTDTMLRYWRLRARDAGGATLGVSEIKAFPYA